MLRRILTLAILGAVVTSGSVDLSACGDKFLRVGGRQRGYAGVDRAAILIYTPVKASPRGIKDLESLLRKAGHTPRAVTNGASLAQAFADGHFDLVIAAYADAGKVKAQLEVLPSTPNYPFVLRTHAMTIDDALMKIDALMAERLKPRVMAAR